MTCRPVARRALSALCLGALASPGRIAAAQQAGRAVRIGWVSVFPLAQVGDYLAAFRAGLAARGHVEGHNLVLDAVSADGVPDRLPGLVDALAQRGPAVIVAQGAAVFAMRRVTDIPVVFGFSGDPVLAGFTDSLARPSGNLTGVTFMQVDLNEKRLALLREVAPAARNVVLMGDPVHPGVELEVAASRAMAARLGLGIRWVPTRHARDVRDVLATLAAAPPDGVVVLPDSVMLETRDELARFALRHGLPAVSGWSVFARSGGLLTYGPHLETSFARLAHYVARILQGAAPVDLPVERPVRFELVANLRTAAAIGLEIPVSLLARADQVLE